jgi:hypothetical protein
MPFVVAVVSWSLACTTPSSSSPPAPSSTPTTSGAPVAGAQKDAGAGSRNQESYETLAIYGVLMAAGEKSSDPNAQAKVDQLGKSSLESLFKVDADRVELTDQGFVVH